MHVSSEFLFYYGTAARTQCPLSSYFIMGQPRVLNVVLVPILLWDNRAYSVSSEFLFYYGTAARTQCRLSSYFIMGQPRVLSVV